MDYDLFNGDADGICALHQLRLEQPREAELVTGTKREITLLERIAPAAGDRVTVCDISLDSNRQALERVLAAGAEVTWFDHHFAGELPGHSGLTAHIDTAAETCTSLIVDRVLEGARGAWAVVGAFGDNFDEPAQRRAGELGYSAEQAKQLRELGLLLNYNGYGATLDDLFFAPDELYRRVRPHADPFGFIGSEPAFGVLQAGYREDRARADALVPELEAPGHAVFLLPDEPWARRIGGVLGNELARRYPARAHALLTRLGDDYRVSVRAPLENRQGADALCREFVTGGGRAAAAGINRLPQSDVEHFIERFRAAFP